MCTKYTKPINVLSVISRACGISSSSKNIYPHSGVLRIYLMILLCHYKSLYCSHIILMSSLSMLVIYHILYE